MAAHTEIIVSDIHLGAVPEETEREFRRFLRWCRGAASALLIPGDLFDFWFEYRTVFPAEHFRVLAELADLVESGVPVRFLGGNHDAWAGELLSERVGVHVLPDPSEIAIAGRRSLVVHGDDVGEGEPGYRVFRRMIRSKLAESVFRRLHPDLGARIADRASSTRRRMHEPHDPRRSRSDHIEAWARRVLDRRPDLDLVVAGHAHEPRIRKSGADRWYVNPGDWLTHFSFVLVGPPPSAPRLWRWTDDGPTQIDTVSS